VKLYSLEQFQSMISHAGLHMEAVHGSYDEGPYNAETSTRMIFRGIKPV